ncbi:hypothetical protein EX30DRAFT_224818 [Ascodesmis nigricans]|uniref:Uncharacterized protein n=1 Tax=Ascodesmis nigricans TaxID=341454 RepID=A0A4S2MJE2_9PEZI|nr:hypothetical protein EX30DRAFT_224818 [Ascodesmis nigricans]
MPPKRALGVDGDRLSTLVAQMPASPTGDDLMKFFRTVADVVAEFNQQKQRRLTVTPACSLDDLDSAVRMFGLDHVVGHRRYVFVSKKKDADVEMSDWLLPTLESLTTDYWRMQTAEALCRSPIDLLLNERLGRIQNKQSIENLALMAEKPMSADVPGGLKTVTGAMDYVIGYGGKEAFTSALIVVEAKRARSFDGGMAQCVAYLVGLQQRREVTSPSRMSVKVYGIVSDGLRYVFLRLDGRRLDVSTTHELLTEEDIRKTYYSAFLV